MRLVEELLVGLEVALVLIEMLVMELEVVMVKNLKYKLEMKLI